MSETMTEELGCLRRSPVAVRPMAGPPDEWHAATTLGASELPVMRPGQLWLVELPALHTRRAARDGRPPEQAHDHRLRHWRC